MGHSKYFQLRFLFIFVSIFLLSIPPALLSQELTGNEGTEFDSLITTTIDNSIDHYYAEAESAAVEIIERWPESPAGYFYRAGVINSMMLDYEENYREDDFYQYIDQAVERAEILIDSEPENPWGHFYRGGAAGYLAFHHTRNKHFFSAFRQGLKAIKELDRTIEIDSTLYDAYLGVGNYKYWLSRRTEFLKWLPFIKDRREEGISLMYQAMKRGKYSRDTAASSLAWALINAGRYDEICTIAEEALKRHPGSRFFLFAYGRSLFQLGRYEESIEVYIRLLQSIRAMEHNNYYNEISVLDKLTNAHYLRGNYRQALNYAKEGLSLPLSEDMRRRKKTPLERMETYKAKCLDRIALEQ